MDESGASDLDGVIDLLFFSAVYLTCVKQLTEPQIRGNTTVLTKKPTNQFLALCRKAEEFLINESIVPKVGHSVMICDNVRNLSELFWYDFVFFYYVQKVFKSRKIIRTLALAVVHLTQTSFS